MAFACGAWLPAAACAAAGPALDIFLYLIPSAALAVLLWIASSAHPAFFVFTAAGTLDLMLQKSERTRVVNLGVGIRHQCGVKPCLHRIHELAPRIRCEGLQFRRVHSRIFFPFSMAAISSRR